MMINNKVIFEEVEELKHILSLKVRSEKVAIKDIKLRTFIAEGDTRDDLAAHVYDITYGTVQADIDNLVIIDDSIVRGTTLKQSIIKILADGNASGEFVLEDLNTTALCVVGAMTFVVVEPLDPAQNTKFDQQHKDYFSKQIADFCVDAVRKK